MDLNFTEAITEFVAFNTVCAELTKEQVADIFKQTGSTPKNDNMEPDDSYALGEVQFNFDKESGVLSEILIFPVYETDGELINGDFINAPDDFWKQEDAARKYLKDNM